MLTAEQLRKVGNFDQSTIAALQRQLGSIETLSAAGACSPDVYETKLTISGTMAFTLAAPTVEGQRKKITADSAASTPAATLTITSPDDVSGFVCSSTFFFDTAGQSVEFVATAALKWRCVAVKRAGGVADNVVIGTTVLTGKNLWLRYLCSVTGTASSTTTKSLPNGSAVGERIILGNTTAASIPVGNINGTFKDILGAAKTDAQAIGATTDTAILEWDGSAWQVMYSVGITFA